VGKLSKLITQSLRSPRIKISRLAKWQKEFDEMEDQTIKNVGDLNYISDLNAALEILNSDPLLHIKTAVASFIEKKQRRIEDIFDTTKLT